MNLWELLTAKLYKWYKGHEGVADAHHTPYTDAEAVAAILADDTYLKNTGDSCVGRLFVTNPIYPVLPLKRTTDSTSCGNACFECGAQSSGNMLDGFGSGVTFAIGDNTCSTYLNYVAAVYGVRRGSDFTGEIDLRLDHNDWSPKYKFNLDHFNMMDKPIKDIKNHAASALSGVKKLVEIDIGGTPYYFEVYPTKA